MREPVEFKPDGNDLKRVLYYYGIDMDEKIICPFHDDNNPSCTVDLDEGRFHCFACGVSGDAFRFVQLANPKLNGLKHLILYFALLNSDKVKKLKLSKLRKSKTKKQKAVEREYDFEIAHDFYYGLRQTNWLRTNEENILSKKYMMKRGFEPQTLIHCGAKLTITDKNYPIVFPIMDMDEFRGYVCRTFDKEVEKRRKYLYNKGFSRVDTLGGDYSNKVVVLCEGYMDRLKLTQFGLKHAVAIFGWKITSQQIEKLKAKGVETVISALDMDEPGRKGTDYLYNFFDVVEFQFPDGVKDPGDLDQEQFDKAYRKTKQIYRKNRRNRNVNSAKH